MKQERLSATEAESFIRARIDAEAAIAKADSQKRDRQEETAIALLGMGLSLIPSEYLRDDQFVVSVEIYEAAKRIIKRIPE